MLGEVGSVQAVVIRGYLVDSLRHILQSDSGHLSISGVHTVGLCMLDHILMV